MSITITWHGHSCFSVSADGYSIVLDPYAPDSVPDFLPFLFPLARCCAAMATVTTAIRTRWTFPPENRALPLQSR